MAMPPTPEEHIPYLRFPGQARLRRFLLYASRVLLTGCVATAMYIPFADIGKERVIHGGRFVSPDLSYYISQDRTDNGLYLGIVPVKEGEDCQKISLGKGSLQRVSGLGSYITVKRDNKTLVVDRAGKEVVRLKNAKMQVSGDEKTVAVLEGEMLRQLSLPSGRENASIRMNGFDKKLFSRFDGYPIELVDTGPDNSLIRAVTSLEPAEIRTWRPGSTALETLTLPGNFLEDICWIGSHDSLAVIREQKKRSIFLISGQRIKNLRQLNLHEHLGCATPCGNEYLTLESSVLDKEEPLTIARFGNIESGLIAERTMNYAPIISMAVSDGRFVVSHASKLGSGINRLTIFSPPDYGLERIVDDAIIIRCMPKGTVRYWKGGYGLSGAVDRITDLDASTGAERVYWERIPMREKEYLKDAYIGLSLIPLIPMFIMAAAYEHRKRPKEKSRRKIFSAYTENFPAIAAAASAGSLGYYLLSQVGDVPYYKVWASLPAGLKVLSSAQMLSMCFAAAGIISIPAFCIGMFKRPAPRHAGAGCQEMRSYEYLDLSLQEEEMAIGGYLAKRGNLSEARVHLYKAVKLLESKKPSQFSYFHWAIDVMLDATAVLYGFYSANSNLRENKRSAAIGCLEKLQAYLITKGYTKTGLSMTDALLKMNDQGSEPHSAITSDSRLHQARIHTLLCSEKAPAMWKKPLEKLIAEMPGNSYTKVHGGTSEVLKVPKEKSPYAENAVIIKRSSKHEELLHEYLVTAEISSATGWINGPSSVPLLFIDGTNRPDHKSYFFLLQYDGQMLCEKLRRINQQEIETYVHETLLTETACFHDRLKKSVNPLKTNIPRMDYAQIFLTKFAKRVAKDNYEGEEIVAAGEPLVDHMNRLPRQAIHNDLHIDNILVPFSLDRWVSGKELADGYSENTPRTAIIDPADAVFAHDSLDIFHLLHEPALGLDSKAISIMTESYRQLRKQRVPRQHDAAGELFRLCHLVGRDNAYNRPDCLSSHAAALLYAVISVPQFGIPGLDHRQLAPIERIARRIVGG